MLSQSEFLQYAKAYSVIPICMAVCNSKNPNLSMQNISKNRKYVMYFESGDHGTETGRYTYYGDDPFLCVQAKDKQILLSGNPELVKQLKSTPEFQAIKQNPRKYLNYILDHFRSPYLAELPPFTGGGLGYFSYEFVNELEKIDFSLQTPADFSVFHIAFVKEVLAYDHYKKQFFLIYNVLINNEKGDDLNKLYFSARKQLLERVKYWRGFIKSHELKSFSLNNINTEDRSIYEFNPRNKEIISAVKKIKEQIRLGEIFQTVISQKIEMDLRSDKALIYQVLRMLNPSPYMFYLQLADEVLLGTSPETLVKVTNKQITTFPIAGTRPRGKNQQEEEYYEKSLLADAKEIAEHVMLIDLARNDIGKVSKAGTVKLIEKMKIEKYSHVMHLVSKVTGELKTQFSAVDALIAAFPAGTVSGAPKVRAMEIIAELEQTQRGPYAGAIVALGFNGNIDTCITIRSIFIKKEKVFIQSGAGIVADSDPEKEQVEIINKAKAMLRAVKIAEKLGEQSLVELRGE